MIQCLWTSPVEEQRFRRLGMLPLPHLVMVGENDDKAKVLKNVINFLLEIAFIQVFSFFTNKT